MDYFGLYGDSGVLLDVGNVHQLAEENNMSVRDFAHPTVSCTFEDFLKDRVWDDELYITAPDFRFYGNVGMARLYLKPLLKVRGSYNPLIKGVFVIG